ncbi:hypothetical protein NDU88_003718 [Pleurodeles waltl]|uniref:Uncharacterized protein n=1 Tax=Pleurodeles waltl TaxID=8319 RepID=A0AAV7T641_PLEWA|nr:hypothetical protein NDU88_003718 [Pleurodeles waltl]
MAKKPEEPEEHKEHEKHETRETHTHMGVADGRAQRSVGGIRMEPEQNNRSPTKSEAGMLTSTEAQKIRLEIPCGYYSRRQMFNTRASDRPHVKRLGLQPQQHPLLHQHVYNSSSKHQQLGYDASGPTAGMPHFN